LNAEKAVADSEERVVFDLVEDNVTPEAVVPVAGNEELMAMSEFIKNLDVSFEIVSPVKDVDFTFTSPKTAEVKEVQQPKATERQEQTSFSFDLPIRKPEPTQKVEENKVFAELTNEARDIKVNQPVEFVPVTEVVDKGIIKYSLEEYMEVDDDFRSSKPVAKVAQEVVPAELNITMKQVDTATDAPSRFEEISPMEMTIEETLKLRADERRKKLKEFNYKFHNNVSKIDEYEREPAYKRLGIDISNTQSNNTNSRISVGTDSNNDLQLRSNNSFLHDNVD
jgi:cell division protein FtsZ